MKFLQALREAHEEDENAFLFSYCMQLFEEKPKLDPKGRIKPDGPSLRIIKDPSLHWSRSSGT